MFQFTQHRCNTSLLVYSCDATSVEEKERRRELIFQRILFIFFVFRTTMHTTLHTTQKQTTTNSNQTTTKQMKRQSLKQIDEVARICFVGMFQRAKLRATRYTTM